MSKIDIDIFQFTGVDVLSKSDGIDIFIEDYVKSLDDILDIRKVDHGESLTKYELAEFMKKVS